jgi:tetratricopeptide (TPR) repeat protein
VLSGCSQLHRSPGIDNAQTNTTTQNDSKAEVQLYQKAITHLNYNELDEAESIFLKLNKKHPNLAGPTANLGLIQLKRDKLDDAKRLLKDALEKNPKLPQALNLLGVVEQKNGNINEAEALYTQAIKEKADYALAHYNLALLCDVFLGDINKAVLHYERYLDLIEHTDQETVNWLQELKYTLETNGS